MKTPGVEEVGGEGNKASLCTVFLHFLVLLLCFTLLTFCFLFFPPWLEVYDLLSGPNLLKAFNKQTVLEKNKQTKSCVDWSARTLRQGELSGVGVALQITYLQ